MLVSSSVGLCAKHLVAPSAKPTCVFMGRSGPSSRKGFVAANALQLFNATSCAILVVNTLFMLCSVVLLGVTQDSANWPKTPLLKPLFWFKIFSFVFHRLPPLFHHHMTNTVR